MKFFLLVACLSLLPTFSNATPVPVEDDIRIWFQTNVVTPDGCEWDVRGYIDVSFDFGSMDWQLDGFGFYAAGPCGGHGFNLQTHTPPENDNDSMPSEEVRVELIHSTVMKQLSTIK